MLASKLFVPTLKEEPAEAEVVSHRLLLRAGMIRKVSSGIYTFLPLGLKVLEKVKNIIREELDKTGAQEILLPIVQPADLWRETGRWEVYGDEMFRLKDRHNRNFCLGPTHEEIITSLIKLEIKSYKQLPLLLYQIQNKYRDEKRPRFGIMRGREFIMKDLYSFDASYSGMVKSYELMYNTYVNIFKRCGLKFRAVEADTGAIGGNISHEFTALAEAGETEVVYCQNCDYAASIEKAESFLEKEKGKIEERPLELVSTPGARTINDVSKMLEIPPERFIKTLLYEADGKILAVLVRGDREVNETKLKNTLGCLRLEMVSPMRIKESMQLEAGFLGPVGLEKENIPVYADYEVIYLSGAVCGANKQGYHYCNAVPGRDFTWVKSADLHTVQKGDSCPRCQGILNTTQGIEVGQVFQLGTKYSEALNAIFVDENGKENFFVMGCYGIGVSRTVAAVVEQNHDENGIAWPISVAPYQAVVIAASAKNEKQINTARKIYQDLKEAGWEVVLDDREERAGVKFKDADLIGYPIRITVGNKTIEKGTVDIKIRGSGKEYNISMEAVCSEFSKIINSLEKI